MDGQISNEGSYNGDWNPVWNLTVGRFEGGWVAEAAIPFKSIRFAPGTTQVCVPAAHSRYALSSSE